MPLTFDRGQECPRCFCKVVEVRCIDMYDCGGCETCDGMFGGTYICGNAECPNRLEALKWLDPEGHACADSLRPPPTVWSKLLDD